MWPVKPKTNGGTCPGGWWIGGYAFGFEHTVVRTGGRKYLGRWIIYIAGRSFRLHRFYHGDDMRAPHDHPWWFVTFPLCKGYRELVPWRRDGLNWNWVKGWRFHYRPSSYRHIVCDPEKPFWTIVLTGRKSRSWGFWPSTVLGRYFVHWTEWE